MTLADRGDEKGLERSFRFDNRTLRGAFIRYDHLRPEQIADRRLAFGQTVELAHRARLCGDVKANGPLAR